MSDYKKILADFDKSYGKGKVVKLGDAPRETYPTIPSGSIYVDNALGGNGYAQGRIIEIYGGEGSGKCLTKDHYVLTAEGYKTVTEILQEQGQEPYCVIKTIPSDIPLINRYGNVENAKAITFNGRKPVIKIGLHNGLFLKTTQKHPHLVLDEKGYPYWKNTESIKIGDYILTPKNDKKYFGEDKVTEEEAYLLGVLVADGCFLEKRVTVTNDDPEVIEFIRNQNILPFEKEYVQKNGRSIEFHSNGMERAKSFYEKFGLKTGVAKNKYVPYCIRTSSEKIIKQFLKGYFICESHYVDEKASWQVSSASYTLLREVSLLLQQIGVQSRITSIVVKGYEHNDYWSMCVYSRDLFNQEDKSRFPFLGNQVYCLYNSLPKDFKNRTTLKVFKDYVNDWKSKITPFSFNKIKNLINSLFEEKEIPIEIKNLLENLDNIINNYGLVKVESVEMGEKEPTFDFYMPETSSFILEGVITHNTTLTLHAIAEAQKLKMQAGFIDMEHAFNADYAETIGVNVEELFFTQPDYGEEALNILIDMVKSHLFGLIVVDSVASLVPKSELEGEVGEAKMGVQARMMGQAMRKVVALAEKANCTIIFINQTREKIGVMFGDPTTTSGGNALKFACSQRLHITQSSKLKNGEDIYGNTVRVNVIKNKIGKPFKKTQFNLIYGKGIDKLAEIIDLAVETEVMKKAGAGWYSYGETKLCQGNDKLVALLEDNPELLEEIKTKTMAKL